MTKSPIFAIIVFLSLFSLSISSAQESTKLAKSEPIQLLDFQLMELAGQLIVRSENANGQALIKIKGKDQEFLFENGTAKIDIDFSESGKLLFLSHQNEEEKIQKLYHISKQRNGSTRTRQIPLWLSLIPPLIAIILALIFKEVILSLFVGIWSGAFIAGGMRIDSFYYFFQSFYKTVETYIIGALKGSGHISVIVFTLLIGGMVAIISKNGGMAGVVKSLSRYAKTAKSSQFITWCMGLAIFFDDYANTLIVGNTMRSLSDKFRISREKLAYIVDSTAAPVAAIAFITTWIGAELGFIESGTQLLENYKGSTAPYSIFIASLKYSFYPILTLIFILMLIHSGKDFGPMLKAEQRARNTGQVSPAKTSNKDEPNMEDLSPVEGAPLNGYNAVIPVLTVIFMTVFGLLDTGMQSSYNKLLDLGVNVNSSWSSIWSQLDLLGNNGFFMKLGTLIGNADSYIALLWSSLSGVVMAIVLTVGGRIMKLFDTMHWMISGFKTMLPALIILTLAWALALITGELQTADYISSALEGNINPYLMPVIIFVLAASISFSTGSSWSTMAILYPIAIPSTWAICMAHPGLDPSVSMEILLNVISTVLAASVLGDHISPISDTSILSSLASDCNHIDHVRTQLPYALTVGVTALFCNFLSTFLGGGWLISLVLVLISLTALYLFIHRVGTESDYSAVIK